MVGNFREYVYNILMGGITGSILTSGALKTQVVDSSGNVNSMTSNALDVNIKSGGATLEVHLSNANDDILIYGWDGTNNQKIKTDTNGELQVDVLTAPLPTDAATATNQTTEISHQSNISTNTSNTSGSVSTIASAVKADDAAFTPGTSKIMVIGAEYDDTSPDPVDEGDVGAPRMSVRRELYIQIRDAAGNERGVNVNASNEMGVVAGAGTANIGRVGANALVSVAITRANNATQYAINDVMNNGTDVVPLIFAVAVANNGKGWVVSGKAISSNGAAGTLPQIDLLIFTTTFTIAGDNLAFAPLYAQMQTCIGLIRFTSWRNRGGIAEADGSLETSFPFAAASGTTNIYGVPLLQNTYTPAGLETLQFTIGVEQYS